MKIGGGDSLSQLSPAAGSLAPFGSRIQIRNTAVFKFTDSFIFVSVVKMTGFEAKSTVFTIGIVADPDPMSFFFKDLEPELVSQHAAYLHKFSFCTNDAFLSPECPSEFKCNYWHR